jgi:hypothetical protein
VRIRKLSIAGLCAAAGLLAAAGLPAAAQAAGDPITIESAGGAPGNPSLLEISAADTAADITTITAQLTPVGGGTAYTVPALTLTSGTEMSGTWSTTIPSGAIAAGNYTISVSAGDSDSNTVDDADAGTLAYLYQPTLTANVNVATIDYGDQSVTFSGLLTAVPPGGGTQVDESGVPVYYEPQGGTTPEQIATTQNDGSYTATVTVTGDDWFIGTDATSTVAATQSSALSFGPAQTQVNNTTLTPASLKYGETATLTGTVNFGYGTGVVANGPVQVTDGSVTLPTVTTNAEGEFTISFPTADGENLQITTGEGNDLLTPSGEGISFSEVWPLREKLFTARLDGQGYVVSGICLQTSPPNFYPFDPNSVELQYAAKRGGPWRKLGMIPGVESFEGPKSCNPSQGWSYYSDEVVPFPGRLISAYYRVVIAGNGSIDPFTSPVVYSSLDRTRIRSFSVSPRDAYDGDSVTFSGVLQRQHGRSWSDYAGQRVYIVAWPPGHPGEGGTVFYTKTGSSGAFSRTLTAGSGKGRLVFAAVFDGNSRYLWSASSEETVAFNGGAMPRIGASWFRGYLLDLRRLDALPAGLAGHLLSQF